MNQSIKQQEKLHHDLNTSAQIFNCGAFITLGGAMLAAVIGAPVLPLLMGTTGMFVMGQGTQLISNTVKPKYKA